MSGTCSVTRGAVNANSSSCTVNANSSTVNANSGVRENVLKVVEVVVNDLNTKHATVLQQKDATIAEKDATIAEKDATIAEKDTTIVSLNSELSSMKHLKRQYETALDMIDEHSHTVNDVSKRNCELLSEISGAKTEIVKLFNERNELRINYATYEQTIKRLQTEIDTLKREYAEEQLNNSETVPVQQVIETVVETVVDTVIETVPVPSYQEYANIITELKITGNNITDTHFDRLIAYWGTVKDYTIKNGQFYGNSTIVCDIICTLRYASNESQVTKLSNLLSTILIANPKIYIIDIGQSSFVYHWIQQQCNIRYSTKEQVDLIRMIVNQYIDTGRYYILTASNWFIHNSYHRSTDKYYNEYKQLFDNVKSVAITLMKQA